MLAKMSGNRASGCPANDDGSVQQKSSLKFPSGKTSQKTCADYGVAEAAGEDVVLIVVFVSVLLSVAGEGFTTVVLVSFFSPAGGFTVSVFCSQAASNDAAPAKMQMYFFISCRWKTQCGSFHIRGKGSFRPYAG